MPEQRCRSSATMCTRPWPRTWKRFARRSRRLLGSYRSRLNNSLDDGGWWLVLGVAGFVALFWLRGLLGRVRRLVFHPRKKKRRTRADVNLREDLPALETARAH